MAREHIKKYAVFFLIILTTLACPGAAWSVSLLEYFDKNVSYDIYLLSGDDPVFIIKDVEIIRVDEIEGRKFLVIKKSNFTFKAAEGYVHFDSVQAIIPNREIKFGTQNSREINF
jgi:hypothetical protein